MEKSSLLLIAVIIAVASSCSVQVSFSNLYYPANYTCATATTHAQSDLTSLRYRRGCAIHQGLSNIPASVGSVSVINCVPSSSGMIKVDV